MNDFTLDNVNEMYIDVLREIGNIGAGNATTSVSYTHLTLPTILRV